MENSSATVLKVSPPVDKSLLQLGSMESLHPSVRIVTPAFQWPVLNCAVQNICKKQELFPSTSSLLVLSISWNRQIHAVRPSFSPCVWHCICFSYRRGAVLSTSISLQAKTMPAAASASEQRGIPAAPFVHDVRTFLTESNYDASTALAALQDRLQQYKLAEMKLLAQRRDLQAKIPDIKKCVDVVGTLIAKKGTGEVMKCDFELAEGIYSRALIEETDSVCLWLGANVMLEYSTEEAMSLLQKNLENAKGSLQVAIDDLQFLRDQVTITEVTIARVYNWDVHQRRKLKNQQKEETS